MSKKIILFVIFVLITGTLSLIQETAAQTNSIENLDSFDSSKFSLDKSKFEKIQSKLLKNIEKMEKKVAQGVDVPDDMINLVLNIDNVSEWKKIQTLFKHGVIIETVAGNLVQVKVPYNKIKDVADLEFVNYARDIIRPIPDITSEGTGVINSNLVNNGANTGQGVRVAVIDSGFNVNDPEISGNIVEAISFRTDGDITGGDPSHGTATAQIIVDVAPNVELYLYNANTFVEWLILVQFLIDSGQVDIISMSQSWIGTGAYDGTSTSSQAVNNARNNGILWVNSAGNSAEHHWDDTFSDSDGDGFHNFSGADETIEIFAFAGEVIFLQLTWNETWGSSSQDYDLGLFDSNLNFVTSSENPQFGFHNPQEIIEFAAPSTGTYHVVIFDFFTTQNKQLELFSYNGFHNFLEYVVPSSSITSPADASGSFTVGAKFWQNDNLESFSSRGPTNDGRIKPDISAPDGVTTSTIPSFFGTSASAPYVAGAAALAKFANPGATPSTIQSLLEQNTFSNHPKNNNDGTGRLDVSFLIDTIPPVISASGDVLPSPIPVTASSWKILSIVIVIGSPSASVTSISNERDVILWFGGHNDSSLVDVSAQTGTMLPPPDDSTVTVIVSDPGLPNESITSAVMI